MSPPPATCELQPLVETTPACLRARAQWVCWKYVQRGDKWTKSPVNPHTGEIDDANSAATWGTFEKALETFHHTPHLAGVGFVFTADDPFCGIDLDDCIDPATGAPKPWGQQIIDSLSSYSEISPSGTGVKVFIEGIKPGERCRRAYHDGEVEIYDRGRFFAVTGQKLPESASTVAARQSELEVLYSRVFGLEHDGAGSGAGQLHLAPPAALEDDQILEIASRSRSGAKFQELWSGTWQPSFKSHSEADSSLMFMLAFYTKDPGQLDRLFRRSGLMRDKWNEFHGPKTYGQITIGKALARVTHQYDPKSNQRSGNGDCKHQRQAAPPLDQPGVPSIIIDDIQLNDLTTQALSAIELSNSPPSVFVRAGQLARVVRDENGVPGIEALDRVRMRCRLSEIANFFTLRKTKGGYEQVGSNPPLSLAENLLALGNWKLPALAGITRSPILRHDGSICATPGYDAQTRLFYCPDPALKLPPIPDEPDPHEVDASVDMLLNLIGDFPFADVPSRANAISLLFSLLMRPVIAGHVPVAIIDAPVQGSGKTLLAMTMATIAVGSVAGESIPSKQNEDEWRKKITSILLKAGPFVLLDNVPDNTTIDAPALAAVLTAYEWSDRLLGKNDSARLPARAVWAATGNNLRVAGDIPRRSYGIRLDANAERPWERTGFRIVGIEQYVARHRGELLAAAFTIIRAWYVAGQPRSQVPVMGSFEEWASTVGSVLAFAGIQGFLENLAQTRAVQDEHTQQWTIFFEVWWEKFGSVPVTVDDLCRRILTQTVMEKTAIPDVLLLQRERGEGSLRRSLGRNLSRLSGRVFNKRKLAHAAGDTHRKVRAWQLKPQDEGNSSEVTPLTPPDPAANPAAGGGQ
jgi:hypothetical protein